MRHYRTTPHSKYDLKVHIVFILKYRKRVFFGREGTLPSPQEISSTRWSNTTSRRKKVKISIKGIWHGSIERFSAYAPTFRLLGESSWVDQSYNITRQAQDLLDHVSQATQDIQKEVIGCLHKAQCTDQCTKAFKIIPRELAFYQRNNLALPRLCPNCRHHERMRLRNPINLYGAECQCRGEVGGAKGYKNTKEHKHGKAPCKERFETTYSPLRQELVYCQDCYQAERQ